MSLDEMIKTEAKNSGISQKNADKALKLLKSGKISINDIAPQLKETIMKQNEQQIADPRERLRNKLKGLQRNRHTEFAKKAKYDKKAQEIKDEQKEDEKKKDLTRSNSNQTGSNDRNKKKRLRKKMLKINNTYGKISDEIYLELQKKLKDQNLSADDKKDVIKQIQLYQYQLQFKPEINTDDLDDLIIE